MITFIVCALDEEENIGPTILTIHQVAAAAGLAEFEIIVIDDGSTDGTYAKVQQLMAESPRVRCVRHPGNLGMGMAIRSGIAAARYPHFMLIPGDNDVHRDFILAMLAYRGHADLILSAPLNKELRTVWRNVVSILYQMLYMASFRVFLAYINGPGIWPTDLVRSVNLRSRRFAIIAEMNVKILRKGCSYAEVPGYFQAGPKARATVTVRNLTEVAVSYLALVYEVFLRAPQQYRGQARRVQIKLTDENRARQ